MKKIKSFVASLPMAVLLTGLALTFNACSEQSPLQSNDIITSTKRAPGELNILKSKSGVSLNKLFVKEKLITVADGGRIEVGDRKSGKSRLDFQPGDVSQDVLVTFSFESTEIGRASCRERV